MSNQDFTEVSKKYKELSVVQNSAADILMNLLKIKHGESILDVGCGTGNLTKRLFDKSERYVLGIDPSHGMIEESIKNYGGNINFKIGTAESISFKNEFDVIFCNSAFQWFQNTGKAIENFYRALKFGGRVGIQAPAKKEYSPNFIQAVSAINKYKDVNRLFKHFNSPWFFLDSPEDYTDIFVKKGFEVTFSEIQTIETYYTPEEVYTIFASGAIAGYLNQAFYNCKIDNQYRSNFKEYIKDEFKKQANTEGKVKLIFNRIFLVGVKK